MASLTPASQSPLNVNNFLKQLKWVVTGSFLAYITDLRVNLYALLISHGWPSTLSKVSIALLGLTTLLFLYLLIWLPYIRNTLPDYQHWSSEAHTKSIIPILTLSILIGWSSLFIAFASVHSIIFSFFITCSVYLLVFGSVGLIPTKRRLPSKEM
ncbi:hypothetical protein WALSEDRAFT_59268 [Wallemia mellicola CBS 633.66]|uniref:Uncharacterized protein n=2 Tax=Wallemia mellicola TaxID=1708541 RepID=A0A4T0P5Z4_9BASI|nr:hypothetical protein WALSEDRAFT_59268 [Wallemia mellicola CBS 633.66]TIB92143.1 hypothetical protein E3Q20_00418 [Wallemia mellicola]EIM23576.1 hypothetical protein WALSEDRAFT_59268 [Wallemia mellicola CBS 633.66]TIB93826.1 hypothetical protein E3Q19_00761 [Wallemia mellicola]TIC01204.1 hypothetical protein E3Q18_00767 [Wallemia mellicola]TIC04739.1 hypothetical protein E3Q17_00252 [Wallemia mellicola]|eukprot:XP_006956251.1 hypothetical protein WALSEDRAFT_59268 [Wallemia mellicola CBS 633.66]